VSDRQAPDDLYREAVERLGRTRIAVHLARAGLRAVAVDGGRTVGLVRAGRVTTRAYVRS
jgi:hypothetical protein